MLTERYDRDWLADHLIAIEEYRPYPPAGDREAWESLPADVRAAQIGRGAEALEADFPALPATLFLDYARTGTRARYEAEWGKRRRVLADLVAAECMEGEGRFLDAVADAAWAICEETFWGFPAHLHMQRRGPGLPDPAEPVVDLFAGETAGLLAWVRYLLGERLEGVSPLIVPRIDDEMRRRILDPCLTRDDFWWMGFGERRSVNNWNPWVNSNWLTAALLCERDPARRLDAVAKIVRSVDAFIAHTPDDGGCDEGPGYWGRAGASLLDCLDLLGGATGGALDVYDERKIADIGRYICRAHVHGPWFVNFADAAALAHPSGEVVFRYGRRVGDDTLAAFGTCLFGDAIPLPGAHLMRYLPTLFALDELRAAEPRQPLHRDVWLPQTQFFAARCREGSADGLYVAAKGGHNAESHNHNDVGQFVAYVDGRPVLVDAGVERYTAKTFSPQRYTIWTMQSQYHNLPTIRGIGQSPGLEFAARDLSCVAGDDAAELSMDIAGAYDESAGVKRWRRTIRLDRAGRGTLTVIDEADLAEPTDDVTLSLLTPCGVELAPGRLVLLDTDLPGGRRSGAATVEYPSELLTADVEEVEQTDGRMQNTWGHVLRRIVLHARRPDAEAAFELRIAPR